MSDICLRMVNVIKDKIVHPDGVAAWLQQRSGSGPVAVVTGTYDILQPGNLHVLRMALEASPSVLVILATAEQAGGATAGGVQNPLAVRLEFAACLRCVSGVTWGIPDLPAGFLRGGGGIRWVFGEKDLETDVVGRRLLAVGADGIAVKHLTGCSTGEIRCAIREGRTPVRLPVEATTVAPPMLSRIANERRITVNGCFDILHIGHLRFLSRARLVGDSLTVFLNDDESVSRYKGPTRPILPLAFRREALLAFEMVDGVIPFSGDEPLDVMKSFRPAVHVKGGSFEESRVRRERELVESWGGRLECTPLEEGFSTSNYIMSVLEGGR